MRFPQVAPGSVLRALAILGPVPASLLCCPLWGSPEVLLSACNVTRSPWEGSVWLASFLASSERFMGPAFYSGVFRTQPGSCCFILKCSGVFQRIFSLPLSPGIHGVVCSLDHIHNLCCAGDCCLLFLARSDHLICVLVSPLWEPQLAFQASWRCSPETGGRQETAGFLLPLLFFYWWLLLPLHQFGTYVGAFGAFGVCR